MELKIAGSQLREQSAIASASVVARPAMVRPLVAV